MQMYTYGCPYPANRAFCHELDQLIPECWHVVRHDCYCHCTLGLLCLLRGTM